MLLIDFAKLNCQCLNTTMAEKGLVDFDNLSLLTVLDQLSLGSNKIVREYFPVQQESKNTNLSVNVKILRQKRKIVDVMGSLKNPENMSIYFSTMVGIKPKEYLKQYIGVAKVLCNSSSKLKFVLWFEDSLTCLKKDWGILIIQQAINSYKKFFEKNFSESQILLSSEIIPRGIPQSFAENISEIMINELLSILPFHLRNPKFVKIFDLVHFVWNSYLFYRLPGIYLVGINNKRHFQLFRKIIRQKLTAVFLPLGSEVSIN